MRGDDLTAQQASDLARYFLGPGWFAMTYANPTRDGDTHAIVHRGESQRLTGHSWRDVFVQAGARWPKPPTTTFAAAGPRVMHGDRAVATASSNTMAKRIANALNAYSPDRRGL